MSVFYFSFSKKESKSVRNGLNQHVLVGLATRLNGCITDDIQNNILCITVLKQRDCCNKPATSTLDLLLYGHATKQALKLQNNVVVWVKMSKLGIHNVYLNVS